MVQPNADVKTTNLCVIVRTLVGTELELSVAPSMLVRDLKTQIKLNWAIPITEQKLLHAGVFMLDAEHISDHSHQRNADIVLVRGPAFHFDKKLAHRHIKLTDGGGTAVMHGGQPGYQAAFLSEVLDSEGSYRVRFKLGDPGGNNFSENFSEMYVGVAPDKDRNWSNLKGAYLNHLGVLVDAFDESGWKHWRDYNIRRQIFESVEPSPVVDFNSDGCPDLYFPQYTCEFVMVINMSESELCFLTPDGEEVVTLNLPELQTDPVRICATLGYPKQTVSIVDA